MHGRERFERLGFRRIGVRRHFGPSSGVCSGGRFAATLAVSVEGCQAPADSVDIARGHSAVLAILARRYTLARWCWLPLAFLPGDRWHESGCLLAELDWRRGDVHASA